MSYMLPHLDSGYAVDQAILSEEDRVVIIRFGHDWDPVRNRRLRGAAG
jgi:U5 snRNP protein, DIM1 family